MKQTTTIDAVSAIPLPHSRGSEAEAESTSVGQCAACGSTSFESVLDAEANGGRRLLISCSRCGLLRFLGDRVAEGASSFADSIHFKQRLAGPFQALRAAFREVARFTKLRFVRSALFRKDSDDLLLDCDCGDGAFSRLLELEGARALAITPSLRDAVCVQHRQGVVAVVAEPSQPPLTIPLFDTVCRLRGFAHESDPVVWLGSAKALLRPGGRVVIQTFDSASWAFLITGSKWAGLEAGSAAFAFRGVDIEVLFDYCELRIVRQSHFFPVLNASIWISSLFPYLDPSRNHDADATSAGWKLALKDFAYFALVLLALPLSLVESVCHAGSVLMVEAVRK